MLKKEKKSEPTTEERIWDAISAFEQILEAMPTDRASLEALAHAYEQIGDHVKAKEYTIRLGKVMVAESDTKSAIGLLDKIKEYASDDDMEAKQLAEVIEQFAASEPEEKEVPAVPSDKGASKGDAGTVKAADMEFNIADELAFAWNLLEASELTQEEYSSVVQDLTEISSSDNASTVSVLHVLEGRRFKRLEKIITFAAKDCGSPVVSLMNFELQPESVSLLPVDFCMQRGVIVFELIGDDALVVVMNPYDKKLRKSVETLVGRRCHYFMSLPSEFDHAVEKIPDIMTPAEEG